MQIGTSKGRALLYLRNSDHCPQCVYQGEWRNQSLTRLTIPTHFLLLPQLAIIISNNFLPTTKQKNPPALVLFYIYVYTPQKHSINLYIQFS